jgi:hypothetical protein
VVGVIVSTTLAGVTAALVVARAVPVTTRRGGAHVAPVIAVALLTAQMRRVATRATLELSTTAVLLAALELAWAAVVRPTPVAAATLVVVAVATVVARTRTPFEIARRPTRTTLIVTREVPSATATRIGSAAGAETVVRTRCSSRVVARIVAERRVIAVACAGRCISRVLPGREIARRARSTVVARMAETVVGTALVAAIRATEAWAIIERAVALRSITKRPIAAVRALLRPVVTLVERRTAKRATSFTLVGAVGRTLLVAAVVRAIVTRAVGAGAIAPGRRVVVRATVHRAAVVVAARAALFERAITSRAITTRPIAEATRTRATFAAAARAETVVGVKTTA